MTFKNIILPVSLITIALASCNDTEPLKTNQPTEVEITKPIEIKPIEVKIIQSKKPTESQKIVPSTKKVEPKKEDKSSIKTDSTATTKKDGSGN